MNIKLSEEKFQEYILESFQRQFVDEQIWIGKRQFWVNKIKLMSCSPYFERLFNCISDKEQKLVIPDVLEGSDPVIYQILFNFIYTGWLVLPSIVSE